MLIRRFNSSALPRRSRSRAFTLIEMLVVVSLIVIILGIVVPSVSRITQSTNYASAVNAVTATLGQARAAAMESGRPTAVAFLFDTQTKVYTLQTLELAPTGNSASIAIGEGQPDACEDLQPNGAANLIAAYQALPLSAPTLLPSGTAVFALSTLIPEIDTDGHNPPHVDQDEDGEVDPLANSNNGDEFDLQRWYAGEILNDGDGFNSSSNDNIIPWIFPRNDPRIYLNRGVNPWRVMSLEETNADVQDACNAVRHAMTFAIAFNPDGSVSTNFGDTTTGTGFRDAYIELPFEPLDETGNPNAPNGAANRPYDRIDQFDADILHPDQEYTRPNPEVRLRTASLLAVVDLKSLQAGAGVNEPWFVRPESSLLPRPAGATDPKLQFIRDELVLKISDWIDRNAQIIGFNRFTGATVKR